MSMDVSLKIIGLDKLKKKLQEKNVTQPLDGGIKKATQLAQRETGAATPRITSNLAGSILRPIQFGEGYAKFGTRVEYASFVEYGTQKMEARHMEMGRRVYGEGMFSYGFRKMQDKMKGILDSIAGAIEAKWR